jgi:hypothetical protein
MEAFDGAIDEAPQAFMADQKDGLPVTPSAREQPTVLRQVAIRSTE